jgi:hypothetical protein
MMNAVHPEMHADDNLLTSIPPKIYKVTFRLSMHL